MRRSEHREAKLSYRLVFASLAILALSACTSFNDPDDDPALCENGRHAKPNGECSNPATSMLRHNLALKTFATASR